MAGVLGAHPFAICLGNGGLEREGLPAACQALIALGRGPCSFGSLSGVQVCLFMYVCMYLLAARHAGS